VILKNLSAWPKLGQDKRNMLEVNSNHPSTQTCLHKCVKMQRKKSQHCQVSHLIVWKLRAWFKSLDQVSRDLNLSMLSYFYTIGNLLKSFRRSFVICFMYLMKLFLIMNLCVS
jgi:hypothetical protein